MLATLGQLAPIFIYFIIGLLLKRFALADKSHGEFLLRLVFFVTLPLLIINTISNTALSADKAMLPLVNILVNLACMGVTLFLVRFLPLEKKTIGSMLMSTMIVNNVFMFPFILSIYGEKGFADAILYDFGNAIMVASYTYAVAFKYSGDPHNNWTMVFRVLKSPLFWSLMLGVLLSLSGTSLPASLENVINPLGSMTSPLILIALGIFFSLNLEHLRLVSLALAIRMGLGLLFGVMIATLLGLEGTTFIVVSLCSGAPIGFMALTFSSLAKLDTELTSSAVSLSILIGLFYVPLLMLAFGIPA